MIKINKGDKPDILTQNSEQWTNELLELVKNYGSFTNIPENLKKKMNSHYKHPDILNKLSDASNAKCAYCECIPGESSYIEVEHFEPKSLYPEKTYSWENLLPACSKCNRNKSNFDTRVKPMINPSVDDPSGYLTYEFLSIKAINNNDDKANNTINECDLNRPSLIDARSKIMTNLTLFIQRLEKCLKELNKSNENKKTINMLSNIIDELEISISSNKPYSSFCNWFMSQSPTYTKAKEIINNNEKTNDFI